MNNFLKFLTEQDFIKYPINSEEQDDDFSDEVSEKRTDHFITDIEEDTLENDNFRQVVFTSKNLQVVLMSIPPEGDAGLETHEDVDQFIRVESGEGIATFNGKEFPITDGTALVVPQGTEHNIVNMSESEDLKLYTVYSPPNHQKDVVHATIEDAMEDDEHFDGETDVE